MTEFNTSGDVLVAETSSTPEASSRPLRDPVPADARGWWWGTGRRKTAVARVRIRPAKDQGKGDIKVQITGKQFKTVDEYFTERRDRNDCYASLKLCNLMGQLDVFVRLSGGGFMGQAGAVKLGIARALRDYDPTLEQALRDAGYLTRDAREVERKKYGQPGARKRFQFSKR
ncbi:MAG: 30S ribosomal protein S9 [Phycisphaeraceae bacterium]|nr:30S ribosomal protein S9 [Phycisphaerales bacterium]MCB9859741.1 30S ribosomal protein S9 [Phycisphaeraceae bacterium]